MRCEGPQRKQGEASRKRNNAAREPVNFPNPRLVVTVVEEAKFAPLQLRRLVCSVPGHSHMLAVFPNVAREHRSRAR
jgi:hypothetical protein